jgi:diguanylate cyclase (GGDEF)-like protein/PAS domain S-box-containing protein
VTASPAPIRVLLIEGDADDVKRVRLLLSEAPRPGFHITAVGRLTDGIDELARGDYDVVLLALMLPDSTGLDSFHRIHIRARELPIVVFSRITEEGVAIDAVRAGAEDYIVKGSVDGITFARVVRYAIERKRRRPTEDETTGEYERTEDLYRRIVEYSQGLICTHDLNGKLMSVNPAAAHSLGYTPDEMVGKNLGDFMSPARRVAVGPYLQRLQRDGADSGLLPVVTKGGEERTWQYRNTMYSEKGMPVYIIGYASDVTDLMEGRDELRRLALTDELTGLHNRRAFLSLAEHALKVAQRNHTECLLFYVDVDGLKQINDSLGHHTGSAMIAEAAVVLRTVFRDSDILARVGGDEFAVLAIANPVANQELLLNRLATRLSSFNNSEQRPYKLSLSVGVAAFTPGSGRSVQQMMREADSAMYEQKNRYRGSAPHD